MGLMTSTISCVRRFGRQFGLISDRLYRALGPLELAARHGHFL
jgi:hypothetical protein